MKREKWKIGLSIRRKQKLSLKIRKKYYELLFVILACDIKKHIIGLCVCGFSKTQAWF